MFTVTLEIKAETHDPHFFADAREVISKILYYMLDNVEIVGKIEAIHKEEPSHD